MTRIQAILAIWFGAITVVLVGALVAPQATLRVGAGVTPYTFTAGNITASTAETTPEITVGGGVGAGLSGDTCTTGADCFSGICADHLCLAGGSTGVPVTLAITSPSHVANMDTAGAVTFTATASSGTVNWSVLEGPSGGSVTSGGAYTAPATPGIYHVVATSSDNPAVTDTAVTVVGVTPEARTTWFMPGVTYNGGIPARTTLCATLSPLAGGADNTTAIQNALSGCPSGEALLLNAGVYPISGQGVTIPNNVTLRGAIDAHGRPASMLVKRDGQSQQYSPINLGQRYNSLKFVATSIADAGGDPASGGTLLAVDAVKDTYTATLTPSVPASYSVGEIVYLDQATDSSVTWWNPARSPGGGQAADPSRGWFGNYDRPVAQVMEIASINSAAHTVTFSTPFHITFKTANAAAIWEPSTPAAQHIGVENIYLYGGAGGDGGGGIHFWTCAYCWAKNVEVDFTNGSGVNFDQSFRCELRDSYVHHSGASGWLPDTFSPNPGGAGYLTSFNVGTADSLIENSIMWNGNKLDVMRVSGGGNVLAYNYGQDSWGSTYPTQAEVGFNAAHMTTPHMELIEGNESHAFGEDPVWGNSVDISVVRNNFVGLRIAQAPLSAYSYSGNGCGTLYYEDIQTRIAATLPANEYNHQFIGNALGTSGQSIPAQRTPTACVSALTGFEYNYVAADNKAAEWFVDSTDNATIEQTGNCDFVTGQQLWADGGAPTDAGNPALVPNSLYLAKKPSFWDAGAPWPYVDPQHCTTSDLPAKDRWNCMVDGSAGCGFYRSGLDIDGGF